MITRKFKRVGLLGLDFYVDWIEETGEIIAIKEVHSGRRFMYNGLVKEGGESVEEMFREACGIVVPLKEEIEEVAPAALETEQPKEEINEARKTSNRKSKK